MHHGILQILSPCLWALLAGLLIARTCAAGELDVNFRAGDFGVLERFLGPNDNPRDQRPEYTVLVEDGRAMRIGISNGLWKPVGGPTGAWVAERCRSGRLGTGICTVVLS
jgi:hypothetical protein